MCKARSIRYIRTTVWTRLKQALLAVFGLLIRVRVVGKIGVPLRQGVVVAINHLNGADSIVVQIGLRTRLFFATSAKWFAGRFSRFFMTNVCDSVPVLTGDPAASVAGLRRCIATLRHGGSIGIFPEGDFNRSGSVGEILGGAAYLAVRSGRPVLPVLVKNLRLGVEVDQSTRPRECWTGFRSVLENLLNTNIQLFVGEPILPDSEAPSDPEKLRSELARINVELRQRFDQLAGLETAV